MKHLKTFEKVYEEERDFPYWRVYTKQPRFRISLKKLGMTTHDIEYWSDIFKNQEEWIYMYLDIFPGGQFWTWSHSDPDNPDFFRGEVKVEDYEIKADKYNL